MTHVCEYRLQLKLRVLLYVPFKHTLCVYAYEYLLCAVFSAASEA